MLSKIVVAVLAASAAVIAAPAIKEAEKKFEVMKDMEVHKSPVYKNDENFGEYKEGYGHGHEKYECEDDGAEEYDYEGTDVYDEMDGYDHGYELGPEEIFAKEILCPAYYKVIYVTMPVKCDCQTETRYEKPADLDIKNVKFEKEYKYFDGRHPL
ncbi:hypothetical protein SeLEV6574_g06412 [Synchytrium endobioticum]|nr:hypothetical protein SeLEV6574_g06412 [Synchytrium endobioticum]